MSILTLKISFALVICPVLNVVEVEMFGIMALMVDKRFSFLSTRHKYF